MDPEKVSLVEQGLTTAQGNLAIAQEEPHLTGIEQVVLDRVKKLLEVCSALMETIDGS